MTKNRHHERHEVISLWWHRHGEACKRCGHLKNFVPNFIATAPLAMTIALTLTLRERV